MTVAAFTREDRSTWRKPVVWGLVTAGLLGHGVKDLWQHHTHYVANTRWWPPFCLVVDVAAAAIIVVEIIAGVQFHL